MRIIDAERIVDVLMMNIPGRHETDGVFYPRTLNRSEWEELRRSWIALVTQQDYDNGKQSIPW